MAFGLMTISIPHPIPYQGSKRRLATFILKYAPKNVATLIEPFAGSAALTLAAAARNTAKAYLIGDSLDPLAALWCAIIEHPQSLADDYEALWEGQHNNPRDHYLDVRAEYNRTRQPVHLLYLLARCVKNAVRFNTDGEFNQSADHRRTGMSPRKMRQQIIGASRILARRCHVRCADYADLLAEAKPGDLVYMDPPYQGVSGGRDPRYHQPLDLSRLIANLDRLNSRGVPFLLSFDGSLGQKEYGRELPSFLKLTRVLVNTGRSSQATLNGDDAETVESVYLSPALGGGHAAVTVSLTPRQGSGQLSLLLAN
ncbi:MAG: DNA adenine methylase [Bryobacteraceae bacterium]